MDNLQTLRDTAEEYGGSCEQTGGKLLLHFSREQTGDSFLRSLISEMFSCGVMQGQPAPITPDFLEYITPQRPLELAENVSLRRGSGGPDHIIIDIRYLALA